jgi:proprotein convertase subtilisin/kexin type 5
VTNCQSGSIPISNVCSLCLYPCLTCSFLLFNCTSCVTNATPSVYLSGNSCQNTCPDYTYSNNSNFRCTPCINNCLLCTAATACLSCTNNTFLLNSTCLSPCPLGMTGINSLCQACTNNCKTCSGGTNICNTCLNGTYFINSSCVTSCGTGLFIDYLSQTCIGCTAPCHTCVNTTSTCISC